MQAGTDAALVRAAQAGDEQAIANLLAESLPLVYNVVGKALSGGPDVDDVVQETMLRVVRGLADLQDPERFRSWLIAIAYRQMQDRGRSIRAMTALGPLVEDVSQWPDPAADFVDSTMFRLHVAGERRDANVAARWLRPDDQRVLRLWWQESAGLIARADLARTLGLSVAHAAVRVQRVKAQLALARTLLRAWHASPRCEQLTAAAQNLGGPADPRWFRRLGGHIRACGTCARHERELIPAEHLLTGASLAPILVGLAETVSAAGTGGPTLWTVLQRVARYLTAKPLLATGAAALGAVTVFTYAVYQLPYRDGAGALATPPAVASGQTTNHSGSPPATLTPVSPVTGVTTASYYVAPEGNDTNSGRLDSPFATVARAVSVVRPGESIAVRGGVYRPSAPVEIRGSGTPEQRITLSNYRDEVPTIDAGNLPAGTSYINQRASYWTVQGLEIRNAPQHGYVCLSCQHNIFRRLSIHDNGRTGLQLRDDNTIGNQILDSDFFANHNDDEAGESADGLAIELGSGTGNVVRGCRVYENSDDGLGLHEFTSPVTIDATWSFGNGVNRWQIADFKGDGYGFKLGGGDPAVPVDHVITNSAAWDNATYGFTESGNAGTLTLQNNTAFRNGRTGFAFTSSTSVLRDNVATGNARDSDLGRNVVSTDNSWQKPGWNAAVLLTPDSAPARAARQNDGSLPPVAFLSDAG
jgi:RNA polymerase sigma factor (sigma-70 family)